MPAPDYAEYISIAEAAEEYHVPRAFFYERIKAGAIKGFELPARRGTFMLRSDVVQLMQPKEKTFGEKGQTA